MQSDSSIESADWLQTSDDETVEWWSHPSLLPFLPTITAGIAAVIMGIAGATLYYESAGLYPLVLSVGGAFIATFEYFKYMYTVYVITSDKIVKKVGIYRRSTINITYDKMQHKTVDQSPIERFLGFGDINIATAGTGIVDARLNNVPNPRVAEGLIQEKVSESAN